MESLTLLAQTEAVSRGGWQLPQGYEIRPVQEDDAPALAGLYLAAYSREIVQDLAAAEEEMQQTFAGEYGLLVAGLSPVVSTMGGVVATVLTVAQAPWPETPSGLFLIEVITHPRHRRRGLARAALGWVATRARVQGSGTLALRVESGNSGALALYRALGFRDWLPGTEGERP
ncbi:MAG: GNAT family N-acetyltransferase [Anaerolineae bacterium]|jgi:ribosomal protein S18 acetylase RimI-like enzyme